jgi:hypothetical protein
MAKRKRPKRQTIVDIPPHREVMIEQHKLCKKQRMNSGAPERSAVPYLVKEKNISTE